MARGRSHSDVLEDVLEDPAEGCSVCCFGASLLRADAWVSLALAPPAQAGRGDCDSIPPIDEDLPRGWVPVRAEDRSKDAIRVLAGGRTARISGLQNLQAKPLIRPACVTRDRLRWRCMQRYHHVSLASPVVSGRGHDAERRGTDANLRHCSPRSGFQAGGNAPTVFSDRVHRPIPPNEPNK
jgi:hypothetical protein